MRSRTFRGATEISAQFEPGTDMIVALQKVQNRIAEIRGDLPADLDLVVDRQTPAVFPIYALNLTGGLSAADLHDYGFYVIRPALSRVPGVGHVDVLASDTREIEVIVDPAKLLAAKLTVDDVAAALKGTNLLAAGRPLPGERPAASRARVRSLEVRRRTSRTRRSSSRAARRCA